MIESAPLVPPQRRGAPPRPSPAPAPAPDEPGTPVRLVGFPEEWKPEPPRLEPLPAAPSNPCRCGHTLSEHSTFGCLADGCTSPDGGACPRYRSAAT